RKLPAGEAVGTYAGPRLRGSGTLGRGSGAVVGRGDGFAPAQHGADAREQLARAEGFGEVVVGAQFQAGDPVDLLALAGQHDDRQARAAAQRARERKTVFAGQLDVEHHEIHLLAREDQVHLVAVGAQQDLEAVFAQVIAHQAAYRLVVVDRQNPLRQCPAPWRPEVGLWSDYTIPGAHE